MAINFLDIMDNKNAAICLMYEMKEDGPWSSKPTEQEKVNCFLNFKLSGKGEEAIDLRGYLSNDDEETLWIESLKNHVLPFIAEGYNDGT